MQFKLGTDPEAFLKLGDKFISAYGIAPGTKEEPFEVECGAVQRDGLAFEFNIHPAESVEVFNKNIEVVLAQMEEMVKKVDKDIEIIFTPYATFPVKEFDELPEECKILGCDPDFNALTGEVKLPPTGIQNRPFRTAAGHIHVGWTEGQDAYSQPHFEDARFVAEQFHRSGMFNPKTTEEHQRLGYYGGQGAFRSKSYGVELRAPSNIWVATKESRIRTFGSVMTKLQEISK